MILDSEHSDIWHYFIKTNTRSIVWTPGGTEWYRMALKRRTLTVVLNRTEALYPDSRGLRKGVNLILFMTSQKISHLPSLT